MRNRPLLMLWTAPPQHYPEMTGIFGLTPQRGLSRRVEIFSDLSPVV